MIYFDNAATSMQKPYTVFRAVERAMIYAGGYGRSGHKAAMLAGEMVYNCRETVAEFFGLQIPENVIFTMNATHALNQAIYSLVNDKSKVAITGYEHNSVVRPLYNRKIDYHVMKSELFNRESMIKSAENALENGCNLFIINHVSNVFGQIAPLEEIDKMLYANGASMIVDASQSAGHIDIDASKLKSVKAICMAGHKGLLAPQGIGVLLVCTDEPLKPIMQGGTGSMSSEKMQPLLMPDALESGTPNVPAIAGLCEGIKYLKKFGMQNGILHERRLTQKAVNLLRKINGIEVFAANNAEEQSGVCSFRYSGIPSEIIAEKLADKNICVRAGLHCAPLAHESAGTNETGTIRISFSTKNTEKEVKKFAKILGKIVRGYDKM